MMKVVHPDPKVAEVARLFPSIAVIATAGDPYTLPLGTTVVANGYAPGVMPDKQLTRCALVLEMGLAVLIAAPIDEVRDDGIEQVMARCLAPRGHA